MGSAKSVPCRLRALFSRVSRRMASSYRARVRRRSGVFPPWPTQVFFRTPADRFGWGRLCWGGDVGHEVFLDQFAVVAVEGRVRDAEVPLDCGDGRAASCGEGLFEDGVDGRLDGVGIGQRAFHGLASGAWRVRNASVAVRCSVSRWRR